MKPILKQNNKHFLRLDRGDEVLETLKNYCEENNIQTGEFRAIGSTDDCTLAYYDAQKKDYIGHHFTGQHELINLLGNISKLDNKILVHAHAVISGKDMIAKSGHAKQMKIYITCELILETMDGEIRREFNEKENIALIK